VDEVRALTQRIIADAQRAADIISRVRAMAGHKAPESTPISINSVVEEAMLFLAHELQGHNVSLKLSLAKDLPPVLADRIQLQQVIVNLAVNAVQAMAQIPTTQRHLTLRTSFHDSRVHIAVEDTGPGIDAAHQQNLFDSFFTTKSNGMGMGLPICRSIVETYGGGISASNAESGGAVFSVTLPAAH
jgi:C4-dicarboxylate-specific signal transduction histidine kinase